MRIELRQDENLLVSITNDNLDNDNFVEIIYEGGSVDVNLDELLSAVHAFEQKRIMRIARENKYKN